MREATNPLVAVQMVIDDWTRADMGDECFWEDWPECPTECSLTPNMVKAAIDQQAAVIAELVEALEKIESFTLVDACRAVAAKSLRKHKAGK